MLVWALVVAAFIALGVLAVFYRSSIPQVVQSVRCKVEAMTESAVDWLMGFSVTAALAMLVFTMVILGMMSVFFQWSILNPVMVAVIAVNLFLNGQILTSVNNWEKAAASRRWQRILNAGHRK